MAALLPLHPASRGPLPPAAAAAPPASPASWRPRQPLPRWTPHQPLPRWVPALHGNVLLINWCYMPAEQELTSACTHCCHAGQSACADSCWGRCCGHAGRPACVDGCGRWRRCAAGVAGTRAPSIALETAQGPCSETTEDPGNWFRLSYLHNFVPVQLLSNTKNIRVARTAPFTRRNRKLRFNRSGASRTTATATSQRRRYRSHGSGATDVWAASVVVTLVLT